MNFKNIQAYIKTFGFIIPTILIIINNINLNLYYSYYLIYLPLLYYLFILIFIYYLFKNNNNNKKIVKNKFKVISIIKDKEYLLFKTYLFNLYYSSIIILFIYLFKNNYLYLLLDLNIHIINLFTTIFIIYTILFNNYFILKLFNLFNLIKKNINLFNNISWINLSHSQSFVNSNIKIIKFKGVRNYSTSSHDSVDLAASNNTDNSDINNSEINKFKKKYKGGYLGYQNIQSFGNV